MTQERIKVRVIELVDDADNVRMVLDGGKRGQHGPHASLFDEEGNRRAIVNVSGDGEPIVQLLDAQGKVRFQAGLWRAPDLLPAIVEELLTKHGLSADEAEQLAPSLGLEVGSEVAGIGLYDGAGMPLVAMAASTNRSGLHVTNGRAQPQIVAAATDEGTSVAVVDSGGQPRIAFGLDDEDDAGLTVENDGQVVTLPSQSGTDEHFEQPALAPLGRGSSGLESARRRMQRWAASSAIAVTTLVAGPRSKANLARLLRERAGWYEELERHGRRDR